MKPLFSVVVPLYNKEKEIGETIKSVLNQIISDFELIIVNDGSTDNSIGIVEQFIDPRIKVIGKKNGGVSSARNVGILHAKGSYIAFLDADDIWLPEYLQEIIRLIDEYKDCNMFGSNYSVSLNRLDVSNDKIYSHQKIANYFEVAMYLPLCMPSSLVARVDCFNSDMKFDERQSHGEDLDMWLRLYKKYSYIAYSSRKLVYYNHIAENRACNSIPPPGKHFAYYFHFKEVESRSEKKYDLYQISSLSWMYLKNFKIKYLTLVLVKYRKFAFVIFINIFALIFSNKYKLAIRTQ